MKWLLKESNLKGMDKMNEVTNAELWMVVSTFIKFGLEMFGIIGLAAFIHFKFAK